MSWAVVTGSTTRGGEAISRTLHAAGVDVVLHHSPRSLNRAKVLQSEFETVRPESVRIWEADFALHFAVPEWLVQLGPNFCVCNASAYVPSSLSNVERSSQDLSIHLLANAALLGELCQSLKSVVAVTDIHVERPAAGYLWYNVSKAALQSLMLNLAVEWAPSTRCNVVAPGALPFPEAWTDDARKSAVTQSIPLARTGSFDELASAVKWILLDASYVTGQVLAVDGGRSRVLNG